MKGSHAQRNKTTPIGELLDYKGEWCFTSVYLHSLVTQRAAENTASLYCSDIAIIVSEWHK